MISYKGKAKVVWNSEKYDGAGLYYSIYGIMPLDSSDDKELLRAEVLVGSENDHKLLGMAHLDSVELEYQIG